MKETLTIDRLTHEMEGVARDATGRVVFVEGALPGEEVEVEITTSKKRFARAHTTRVVESSTHRTSSACAAYPMCGGCQCWHMAQSMEFSWKVQAAWENLKRLSRATLPEPVTHSLGQLQYRTRAVFHCQKQDGQTIVGFRVSGSHRLVALSQCHVLHPVLWSVYQALCQWPGWQSGRCLVELASETQAVLTFYQSQFAAQDAQRHCAQWMASQSSVQGIVLALSRRKQIDIGQTDVAVEVVFGKVPDTLRGQRLPGGLFRQANPQMNALLLGQIVRKCQALSPIKHCVELFAGCGNISFALASEVERLTAFEAPGDAVECGQRLAEHMGASHVRFEGAQLMKDRLPEPVVDALQDSDVVLIDPPRAGAKTVCEFLAQDDVASHLLYVSCDPGALGRDLGILCKDGLWQVQSIDMFDMFPRTGHLETLVHLRRQI